MLLRFVALTSLSVAALALCSCRNSGSEDYGDSFEGEVFVDDIGDVADGNLIVTFTDMPVRLIGVKQGYERGTAFLKKYIGEQVHIVQDSRFPQDPVGADTLYGYAVLDDGRCINHLLLEQEPALYDPYLLNDSLESFTPEKVTAGLIPDLSLYMKERTFLIEVPSGGGVSEFGTGFFINDKGLAVTNAHVIDGSRPANCFLFDSSNPYESEINHDLKRDIPVSGIVASDPELDITVFRVSLKDGEKPSFFNLASRHVPQGTKLGTIGNPVSGNLGLRPFSWSNGELGAYRDQKTSKPLVQYTLSSSHGNSGGPVCDPTGQVVAVHAFGDKSMQNSNYGIDILAVREFLNGLGEYYGGK